MARLIDADNLLEQIQWLEADTPVFHDVWEEICSQPTVEAIPIDWILNHEKMPKSGKGHDAIMDMIESWRERREDETD